MVQQLECRISAASRLPLGCISAASRLQMVQRSEYFMGLCGGAHI